MPRDHVQSMYAGCRPLNPPPPLHTLYDLNTVSEPPFPCLRTYYVLGPLPRKCNVEGLQIMMWYGCNNCANSCKMGKYFCSFKIPLKIAILLLGQFI